MSHNFQEEMAVHLSVRNRRDYQSDKVNKGIVSLGSNRTLKDSGHPEYMEARVNKLRELYEQCEPEYEYYYELPEGGVDATPRREGPIRSSVCVCVPCGPDPRTQTTHGVGLFARLSVPV